MISEKDVEAIRSSVNQKYFDVNKLVEYLNTHEIVGNEVFEEVTIDPESMPARLNKDLSDKYGYTPIPVDKFLRRIPFYFFYPNNEEAINTHAWLGAIVRRVDMKSSDEERDANLEKMYQALEDIHYRFHIGVEDIFAYMDIRGHKLKTEQFMEWYDYLMLCEKLHWYDYMPEAFAYKYNLALEAAGRKPVIYKLHEILPGEYCIRFKNTIEIQGTFPVDPAGKPVLRWIGIILNNPGEITCGLDKGGHTAWKIDIQLTPKTELYAQNIYDDEDDNNWYRLYAGPLTMEFDYTVLKSRRTWMGMTQKEVAEAVGATLRTYQKWEIGETTPDSKFLLRLLNWLDIRDVVNTTKWNDDWAGVTENEE